MLRAIQFTSSGPSKIGYIMPSYTPAGIHCLSRKRKKKFCLLSAYSKTLILLSFDIKFRTSSIYRFCLLFPPTATSLVSTMCFTRIHYKLCGHTVDEPVLSCTERCGNILDIKDVDSFCLHCPRPTKSAAGSISTTSGV